MYISCSCTDVKLSCSIKGRVIFKSIHWSLCDYFILINSIGKILSLTLLFICLLICRLSIITVN